MKCPKCSNALEVEGDNFSSTLALACTQCEFYQPIKGLLESILDSMLRLILEILPQELLTDERHSTRQP